jgi:hypothetical protein
MRWFRFYDDALNDPKVQRLSPHLFRTWVNCLCLASKSGGRLPCIEDIAFNFRMSEHDAKTAIEDLIIAGLLDVCPNGKLEPHNWGDRQFASDASKERTRKWRKKKEKTNGDVAVTASDGIGDAIEADTDTETDTDYVPSSESMPREKKQGFENEFSGKGSRAVSARLKAEAEGLGLDVATLETRALAPDVRIPNAMFRKLIVDDVRKANSNIPETLIKAALSKGNDAAKGQLHAMLVGAA